MEPFFIPDHDCGNKKVVVNKVFFEEKVVLEGILGLDDRFVLIDWGEHARGLLLLQRRDL